MSCEEIIRRDCTANAVSYVCMSPTFQTNRFSIEVLHTSIQRFSAQKPSVDSVYLSPCGPMEEGMANNAVSLLHDLACGRKNKYTYICTCMYSPHDRPPQLRKAFT